MQIQKHVCACLNDNWADYLTIVLPKTILKCLAGMGMGHATVNWKTEYALGLDVSFMRFFSVLFCFKKNRFFFDFKFFKIVYESYFLLCLLDIEY